MIPDAAVDMEGMDVNDASHRDIDDPEIDENMVEWGNEVPEALSAFETSVSEVVGVDVLPEPAAEKEGVSPESDELMIPTKLKKNKAKRLRAHRRSSYWTSSSCRR